MNHLPFMNFFSTKTTMILVSFFLIHGCASQKNDWDKNFNSTTISKGMSEKEVLSLLGKPSKSSRQSKIEEQDATVSVYKYQSPTEDGKYLFKELTIIYVENLVKDLNFRERISIEPVKGARVSNKILDISGAKLDI
jgi:hypothetical protein